MASTTGTAEPAQGQRPGPGRPGPRRQAVIIGATLVLGLAVGLGGARLLADRGAAQDGPASVQELDPAGGGGDSGFEAPAPPAPDEAVEVEAATSPEAAVSGFLTAEALKDFEASYAFLSDADRIAYPNVAEWVNAHADLLPIAGFEVEEVREAEVVTRTALESRLDMVLGLIPARAIGRWPTVEEGGGWRVAFGQSTLEPRYPSDEGVAEAAMTWATARQGCETAASQFDGVLVGQPSLAEELCEAEGELVLDAPGPLQDGPETTALLNAYGPEVFTWARTVRVAQPVGMQLVLAPIADAWQVVGILPA